MKYFLGALLLLAAAGVDAQTADPLAVLAQRLADKRAQIEALTSDLDLLKADTNERLRSLATQRADLETQLKREQLKQEQLRQDLAAAHRRIQSRESDLGDQAPLIRATLDQMRGFVRRGIPFAVEGRLAELDNLQRQLEARPQESGAFLARLWNQLESEYRLSGDSGLYKQSILLDGKDQMVEIARLGLTLAYFRTLDDRYGLAAPGPTGWSFRLLTGAESKQVEALFSALRKNLKEGYFPLPNPWAKGSS